MIHAVHVDSRDARPLALPQAKAMLGDRGYDADWFREALIERGIVPCIPSKANRNAQIDHDRTLYAPAASGSAI